MGDQFGPEFLGICPNGRMPAIVDHCPKDGGSPLSVFESGAILMYLAEKENRFFPQGLRARYEVVQWVMWQMANQGPKFGERGTFNQLPPEAGDLAFAKRRFNDEVHRLYGVMNNRLYNRRYLAGDEYTIADIACYPWPAHKRKFGDINLDEFQYVKRWMTEVGLRAAVQRGLAVPSPNTERFESLPAAEQLRLRQSIYNQRARPAPPGGLLWASREDAQMRD